MNVYKGTNEAALDLNGSNLVFAPASHDIHLLFKTLVHNGNLYANKV